MKPFLKTANAMKEVMLTEVSTISAEVKSLNKTIR
jgi:hypothetical protein